MKFLVRTEARGKKTYSTSWVLDYPNVLVLMQSQIYSLKSRSMGKPEHMKITVRTREQEAMLHVWYKETKTNKYSIAQVMIKPYKQKKVKK